jgi:hypothetical protein
MPVGDASALNIKLHELGVSPTYKMEASVENATKKVRWLMDGVPLDGPSIVSLCQKFFVDFIETTNVKEDTDSRSSRDYHH